MSFVSVGMPKYDTVPEFDPFDSNAPKPDAPKPELSPFVVRGLKVGLLVTAIALVVFGIMLYIGSNESFSNMSGPERKRRVQSIITYSDWFEEGRSFEAMRSELPWLDAALYADVRRVLAKSPLGGRRQEAIEGLFR